MTTRKRLIFIGLLISSLSQAGCAYWKQTPGMYTTKFAAGTKRDGETDIVKHRFETWLDAHCGQAADSPPKAPAITWPDGLKGWQVGNGWTKVCVVQVIRYAANQCVVKIGQQNRVDAYATIAVGGVLALGGIYAEAAAASSATCSTRALTAAAVVTSAGNVQKVLPSAASVKVSDMLTAGQSYVQLDSFSDDDFIPCPDVPGRVCVRRGEATLRYSHLHDAVYAVCPTFAF